MKRIVIIFSLLIFTTLISGCSAPKQLHEMLLIQGIGIDKEDEYYNLTIQVLDIEGGGSDPEKDDVNTNSVINSRGRSISDAFALLAEKTGKEPLYSQNLMLVIGEETAKQGVYSDLDFFIRHNGPRPTVDIFISKGNASEIMNSVGEKGLITAKDISDLSKSENLNSCIMNSDVLNFVSCLKGKISDPSAAVLLKNDDEIIAKGTALFKGENLTGYLDENETKGAILINKKAKNADEVIYIDGLGKISYNIINSNSKINVSIIDVFPKFTIEISTQSNIVEIDKTGDLTDEKIYELIRNPIEERIHQLIDSAITKAIFECDSDIFNFGKILKNKQTNYYRQVEANLKNTLKNSQYEIIIENKIIQAGHEINTI